MYLVGLYYKNKSSVLVTLPVSWAVLTKFWLVCSLSLMCSCAIYIATATPSTGVSCAVVIDKLVEGKLVFTRKRGSQDSVVSVASVVLAGRTGV